MEANINISKHLEKMSDKEKEELLNLFGFAKEKGL